MDEVHNSVSSEAANQRHEKQVFMKHKNNYHDLLKLTHEAIMRSNETLLLQALKLKQLGHKGFSGDGDMLELLLLQNPEAAKEKMRNICAFISPELFDDVSNVCNILSLSKRELIEMALVDVLEKAHKVIDDTGALKAFEVQ